MSDVIKRLGYLEFTLSVLVFLIPFILPLTNWVLLDSISDYAYSEYYPVYNVLLGIGVIVFIMDGIKYKNRFNYIIALFLFGVLIFPDEEYQITHNTSAVCFFVMNVFTIIYFSRVKYISIILGLIILLSFVLVFVLPNFTLYMAETISMVIITIKYTQNKILRTLIDEED